MENSAALFVAVAVSLMLGAVSLDSDLLCKESANASYIPGEVSIQDKQMLQAALNLEYSECEFFLYSALGHGLDTIRPDLAAGGPSPKGAQRASLDEFTRNMTTQFGYQEIGHVRAIRTTLQEYAFPRPLLDLSKENFATIFDRAFGVKLNPPFNVYANSINFLLGCYILPYVGLTGYVGANALLQSEKAKRLVAGLLGVEAGQDAVVRAYLAQHADARVTPYTFTVAEATTRLSLLRNTLDHAEGVDDEGLVVPLCLGAEQKINDNILVGDQYSLSYARTTEQVFSIVYGTGNPSCPGSFFPKGGEGEIATSYLQAGCPYKG